MWMLLCHTQPLRLISDATQAAAIPAAHVPSGDEVGSHPVRRLPLEQPHFRLSTVQRPYSPVGVHVFLWQKSQWHSLHGHSCSHRHRQGTVRKQAHTGTQQRGERKKNQ